MAGLWIEVLFLIALTTVTIVATFSPSNCDSLLPPGSLPGQCDRAAKLSEYVRHHVNVFQSIHTFLLQSVGALGVLVFIPKLRVRAWDLLEDQEKGTSIQQLDSAVLLSISPSLGGALRYAWTSKSLTLTTAFVIAMGFLGLVSSFIVAPIYAIHNGPYTLQTPIAVGGGMNVYPPLLGFDPLTAPTATAVILGRSRLSSETRSGQVWNSTTISRNVIPFISDADLFRVWRYEGIGVVANTSIDCDEKTGGFIAPSYGIDSQSPYWSNYRYGEGNLTLNGRPFPGQFYDDPNLSTTYQNVTLTNGTGWIEASSLVTFIVGNNTLEGAQIHLTSPHNSSLISTLDILTCKSVVRLAMSKCTVQWEKGQWNPTIDHGVDTTCTPLSPSEVPAPAYITSPSILDDYLTNPFAVAEMLSTAPIWSIAAASDRLPTYWGLRDFISANTVPLGAASGGAGDNVGMITQKYIKDILFASAQHSLIQGVMSSFAADNNRTANRPASLPASFGTSSVEIQIAVLVVAFVSASLATFFALQPASREAQKLDVPRLIAVSQSPHFETIFGEYRDRKKPIPEDIQQLRVRLNRKWSNHLIMVDHNHDEPGLAVVDEETRLMA